MTNVSSFLHVGARQQTTYCQVFFAEILAHQHPNQYPRMAAPIHAPDSPLRILHLVISLLCLFHERPENGYYSKNLLNDVLY